MIQSSMELAEEHRDALGKLDADGITAFRFGLLRDLLLSNVVFQVALDEEGSRIPRRVILAADVPLEDVTHQLFDQKLVAVNNAANLVVIHTKLAVGEEV